MVWTQVPRQNRSWPSVTPTGPQYICPPSGKGGLRFQNDGSIPKDQNQMYFAVLYNNTFQKQSENNVSGRDKLFPRPKQLSVQICLLPRRWPLPAFPALRTKFCAFLRASCCLATFSPNCSPQKQNALSSSTTLPLLPPPFGLTCVCVLASSWPRGCLLQDARILPTTSQSPLAPTTHTHCRKIQAHLLHKARDHVWSCPPGSIAMPGTHGLLNKHLQKGQ